MFNYQPRVEELELLLLSLNKRNYTMTNTRSQAVSQLSFEEKLRKLGQPKYVYDALIATDAENQAYVEHMVDTILTKGYMPA